MANRPILIGLGLATVIAAAVVLVLALGGGDEPTPAAATPTTATPEDPARPSPPRPSVATGSAAPVAGGNVSAAPYREYVIDGKIIRDHRKGNHPTPDLPPSFHPPNAHRVAATVTRDISTQVRQAIRECTADLPPEARGAKPKLEGQVTIGITAGQVSVTKATMQLRDVVGAAQEPVRACIEQKAATITAAAPDEPDLTDYSINLSLTVL